MPFEPPDLLELSLQELDLADLDQTQPSRPPSPPRLRFGAYQDHSSGLLLKSDFATTVATDSDMESSTISGGAGGGRRRNGRKGGGGYSPPAWRRLGNGDRSSGFWRKGDNLLGYGGLPPMNEHHDFGYYSGDDDDDDEYDDDDVLAAAIRTRLPTGSLSPEKERSPEPEYYNNHPAMRHQSEPRIKSEEPSAEEMKATLAALPPHREDPENCMSLHLFT